MSSFFRGPTLVVWSLLASMVYAGPVTFGPRYAVTTDAATDTQQDQAAAIAADGAGHVVAVWVANKLPRTGSTSELLQLQEAGGECWEATYSGAAAKNVPGVFAAWSD